MAATNPLEDVRGGLPRNFIRSCVLLLVAQKSSHGYDLLDRLEDLGVGATDPGGLYRTLRAMEREDLLRSSWESSAIGPARRAYQLTDDGIEWLHAWAGTHSETRRILGRFLDEYQSLTFAVGETGSASSLPATRTIPSS